MKIVDACVCVCVSCRWWSGVVCDCCWSRDACVGGHWCIWVVKLDEYSDEPWVAVRDSECGVGVVSAHVHCRHVRLCLATATATTHPRWLDVLCLSRLLWCTWVRVRVSDNDNAFSVTWRCLCSSRLLWCIRHVLLETLLPPVGSRVDFVVAVADMVCEMKVWYNDWHVTSLSSIASSCIAMSLSVDWWAFVQHCILYEPCLCW